jgi:hypothetical protein
VVLVFGIGLVVGSWLLFARSDTYVPARAGGRRLVPYELFVPVVCLAVLAWLVDRRLLGPGLGRLARGVGRSARTAARAGVGLLLVLALTFAPGAPEADEGGLSPLGWQAFAWMRQYLEPGSRVLVNAYTDGSVGMLSGGVGIVDGRAAYLEDPDFLGESRSLVLGARRFFQSPRSDAARQYLAEENVEYLLVACRNCADDLAGYVPFPTDIAAIRDSGDYDLVQSFGDRLTLFEVRRRAGGVSATRDPDQGA